MTPNVKTIASILLHAIPFFFKFSVVTFAIVPTYTKAVTCLPCVLSGRDFIGQKIDHKFIT